MGIIDRFDNCPIDDEEPVPQSEQAATPADTDATDAIKPAETSQESNDEKTQKKRRKGCGFWFWFFAIILVALSVTVWIRYFNPYVTDAQTRGYILNIERRGIIFKTFEGNMVSQTAMQDTEHIYSRDFTFSVDNDSLARVIQSYAGTGRPVIVRYRSFYGILPWRGSSHNLVDGIETAPASPTEPAEIYP